MKRLFTFALLILLTASPMWAQRVLTLEECIDIALQSNLSIKRAKNSAEIAKAQYTQSKFNFLPSIGAGASHSWAEGLTFDNFSGVRVNNTTLQGGGSISASMVIFDGFSNLFAMQQAEAQYDAAQETVKGTIQATQASIVGSFLQVISTRETLKMNEETKSLLQEQLEREEKRERAGVGNMEQVYNFRSQIAQQDLNIVNLRNTLETAKLTLIQLLLLDPAEDYQFEGITLNDAELEEEIDSYNDVYIRSLEYSPSVRSAELSVDASRKSLQSAKFNWMPTLSLSAGYGTNWSSNIKDYLRDSNGEVILDGNNQPTVTGVLDVSSQFRNNVRKNATLSLNIPIFTRFQNRTQIQTSKIQMMNSELGLEQAKNDLTNQVQQAYLALVNAKTTYTAARQSKVNLDQSFEFAKTRYENGTIDFVTYLQSLTAKNRGDLELARSKYAILLRNLILDIYTGELQPETN